MNKLTVDLENCYGIKALKAQFDFSGKRAYALYAPNGSMKTSLALLNIIFEVQARRKANQDTLFIVDDIAEYAIIQYLQDIDDGGHRRLGHGQWHERHREPPHRSGWRTPVTGQTVMNHPMNTPLKLWSVLLAALIISLPVTFAVELRLTYDANGNLLTGDGKFRVYNSLNQLAAVYNGSNATGTKLETYIYHPTEERILKKTAYNGDGSVKETTYYISPTFVHVPQQHRRLRLHLRLPGRPARRAKRERDHAVHGERS